MKKQSVKRATAAITAMVTVLTATCACSVLTASAAENTAFPYTMFAASEEAGALTVNAKHFCLNGSIATNGTVVTGSKIKLDDRKKTENAGLDMPFASGQLDSMYFANAQLFDMLEMTGSNVNLNNTVDVAGEATVSGNVNVNASLRADSDISISGNNSNFHNAVIYSEFGDITIDCNNVSLNGVIYAPLGDVVINANNINLNNVVIIADTITLNANNVNANYGKSYAQAFSETETKASYIQKFNSYMMDKEAETVLELLSQYYTVTPLDAGEFSEISMTAPLAPGFMVTLDFEVQQYEVEGYGNLSVMKTDGMQQMSTIVLTPFNKDLPLISTDYMFNGENRVSYIEFYGLGINGDENMPVFEALRPLTEQYARFADQPPTPGWFDEVRTMGLFKVSGYQDDDAISQMLYDSFRITMDASLSAPHLNDEERVARYEMTQNYVNNLISNPGVSTAIFNMCLGADRTTQFFNDVFFGTGLYQPQ